MVFLGKLKKMKKVSRQQQQKLIDFSINYFILETLSHSISDKKRHSKIQQ